MCIRDRDDTKATTPSVQQESTAPVIQESKESTENVTEQTKAAAAGRALSVSGTPETVDYTSSSAYSKAVFIGDFVVSGISQFGFLPDAQDVYKRQRHVLSGGCYSHRLWQQ